MLGRWGISWTRPARPLRALPLTSTPCLGVVQVQLRAARNLCESWIEWWDEIQDLPREAARPERDLVLCLLTLRWFILLVMSWPIIMKVSLRIVAPDFASCYTQLTTRPMRRALLSRSSGSLQSGFVSLCRERSWVFEKGVLSLLCLR